MSRPWPPSPKADAVSRHSAVIESPAPSSALPSSADEMAQTMLGLLAEMEASLEGTQKAVLAGDGLGLEIGTQEQVRLHRALELLLWPRAWPGTGVRKDFQKGVQKNARENALAGSARPVPTSVPRFVAECDRFLAAQLLAAERRVLKRARLQIAGVSLDEETNHIVQYKRAYEASAQVTITIRNMMATVSR